MWTNEGGDQVVQNTCMSGGEGLAELSQNPGKHVESRAIFAKPRVNLRDPAWVRGQFGRAQVSHRLLGQDRTLDASLSAAIF